MKRKHAKVFKATLPIAALFVFSVGLCAGGSLATPPSKFVHADGDHVHGGMVEWTSQDSLPSEAGNYYLSSDVVYSGTWSVPSGETSICLNGHGIKKSGQGSLISIASGATLSIEDCGETVHYFDVDSTQHYAKNINETEAAGRGSFVGGYIGGVNESRKSYQSAALLVDGGTLNLYGGSIIGNAHTDQSGSQGGQGVGVRVIGGGTFNMYGGEICYNFSGNYGAGALVKYGTINMVDGRIHNNKTAFSGGSAIACFSSGAEGNPTLLHLSGGVIEQNYTNNFGAIDVNTSFVNTFQVEGSPIVRNNYNNAADPVESNITLRSDYSQKAIMTIVGTLDEKADIGIKSASGSFTQGWSTYMAEANPEEYFSSDNPSNFALLGMGGEIEFASDGTGALVGTNAGWSAYPTFAEALNAWGDKQTLKMLSDASAQVNVSQGEKTLDLNNHVLTYSTGAIVNVTGGKLHIQDSCLNKTVHYYTPNTEGPASLSNEVTEYSFEGGYIGACPSGGGIAISGGEVVFSSGTVFGNDGGGGAGIHIQKNELHMSSLRMEGSAAVIGNFQNASKFPYTSTGGVLLDAGNFEMAGGKICHNSASTSIGAMRISNIAGSPSTFTMTGGEIYGNYSHTYITGGISLDGQENKIYVGGSAKIYGNHNGANKVERNIAFEPGNPVTLVQPLNEEASIGLYPVMKDGDQGKATAANPLTYLPNWSAVMGEVDPYPYVHADPIYDGNGTQLLASYEVYLKEGNVVASPVSYTVSFSGGSGTGEMEDVIASTRSYPLPGNSFLAPEGMRFKGWKSDEDGKIYGEGATVILSKDTGFTALWAPIPGEGWVGLSGTVYSSDGLTPVEGAAVTLYQGSDIYDLASTDAQGQYQIACPDGYYNIVVQTGFASVTALVEVDGDTVKDIVLTSGKTESTLNVNSDIGVVVGGLDEEAKSIRESAGVSDEKNVSVTMNVEAKPAETAQNADEIIAAAPEKNLEFLEIKVEKTVDGLTQTLDSTSKVLEIIVPTNNVSKRGLVVYSYHDGEVKTFTQSETKEAGTFSLDKENGLVKIYANEFSTFALGYTPYFNISATVTLGSYTGVVSAKLENLATHEVIILEEVALSEVYFEDLAKGQYLLTITWVDGASNTLTMPVNVG